MARRVLVLGSTGSVGRQALEVLRGLASTHRVVGLSAATSARELSGQAHALRPEAVCLVDEAPLDLPAGCARLSGAEGLEQLVHRTDPDIVVCAITGAAGLPSTLAAAERGTTLALANKESLVLAGHLVREASRRSGGCILPVDSEHSAIHQCLAGARPGSIRRLILTASGGPFRGRTRAELEQVTPAQALRHPSWDMGPRITVDSATLMNKALEIVEACQLFDVAPEQIEVVVHPQSVLHSMVEFRDGSILAQLGPPDMKVPLRYALAFPERAPTPAAPVDVTTLSGLVLEAPDLQAFPSLSLGWRVARTGGLAGCVLNAANEVAVEAFLAGRLPFLTIPDIVIDALDHFTQVASPDLPMILETDRQVRSHATARLPQPAS